MNGGGRGDNHGNRRRPFKRHEREKYQNAPPENYGRRADTFTGTDTRSDRTRGSYIERPRWIPPKLSTEPLPAPNCPYCGNPIKDISLAVSDRDSGEAIHFDCVIARLSKSETLEQGDEISYIGGGRFGVVHFAGASGTQGFTIKKIFEWENKDNRAGWRQTVSEHFSVT